MVLFFIGLFWVATLTFYALFMFETHKLKERIIGLSALFFLAAAVAKYLS